MRVAELSCDKKLDGMKFASMETARNEDVESRIAAVEGDKPVEIKMDDWTVRSRALHPCPLPYGWADALSFLRQTRAGWHFGHVLATYLHTFNPSIRLGKRILGSYMIENKIRRSARFCF